MSCGDGFSEQLDDYARAPHRPNDVEHLVPWEPPLLGLVLAFGDSNDVAVNLFVEYHSVGQRNRRLPVLTPPEFGLSLSEEVSVSGAPRSEICRGDGWTTSVGR
jgi:hypothetical protein